MTTKGDCKMLCKANDGVTELFCEDKGAEWGEVSAEFAQPCSLCHRLHCSSDTADTVQPGLLQAAFWADHTLLLQTAFNKTFWHLLVQFAQQPLSSPPKPVALSWKMYHGLAFTILKYAAQHCLPTELATAVLLAKLARFLDAHCYSLYTNSNTPEPVEIYVIQHPYK